MSTLVYYECRDAHHLAAPSRYGIGGIVFRHGTAAYCDGLGADAQHDWVPTGGVPIESLIRAPRIETFSISRSRTTPCAADSAVTCW